MLNSSILIATLGSEAQVIPITVQLLLAQSVPLHEVVVLHTLANHTPIAQVLPSLRHSWQEQKDWPPLRTCEIAASDTLHPHELDAFANTLFDTLRQALQAEQHVHLLLAGGRKSMAMIGMSVAQTLLGQHDHVWYLHSDEGLRTSGRHLLQGDDQAQLIEIPLPRLASAPARFTPLMQADSPAAARRQLDASHESRLRDFVERQLTAAEREVAALVAKEVLTVKEIAERLGKTPKTVTNQLNTIYSKLECEFGLVADVGVKREFLRRELGGMV